MVITKSMLRRAMKKAVIRGTARAVQRARRAGKRVVYKGYTKKQIKAIERVVRKHKKRGEEVPVVLPEKEAKKLEAELKEIEKKEAPKPEEKLTEAQKLQKQAEEKLKISTVSMISPMKKLTEEQKKQMAEITRKSKLYGRKKAITEWIKEKTEMIAEGAEPIKRGLELVWTPSVYTEELMPEEAEKIKEKLPLAFIPGYGVKEAIEIAKLREESRKKKEDVAKQADYLTRVHSKLEPIIKKLEEMKKSDPSLETDLERFNKLQEGLNKKYGNLMPVVEDISREGKELQELGKKIDVTNKKEVEEYNKKIESYNKRANQVREKIAQLQVEQHQILSRFPNLRQRLNRMKAELAEAGLKSEEDIKKFNKQVEQFNKDLKEIKSKQPTSLYKELKKVSPVAAGTVYGGIKFAETYLATKAIGAVLKPIISTKKISSALSKIPPSVQAKALMATWAVTAGAPTMAEWRAYGPEAAVGGMVGRGLGFGLAILPELKTLMLAKTQKVTKAENIKIKKSLGKYVGKEVKANLLKDNLIKQGFDVDDAERILLHLQKEKALSIYKTIGVPKEAQSYRIVFTKSQLSNILGKTPSVESLSISFKPSPTGRITHLSIYKGYAPLSYDKDILYTEIKKMRLAPRVTKQVQKNVEALYEELVKKGFSPEFARREAIRILNQVRVFNRKEFLARIGPIKDTRVGNLIKKLYKIEGLKISKKEIYPTYQKYEIRRLPDIFPEEKAMSAEELAAYYKRLSKKYPNNIFKGAMAQYEETLVSLKSDIGKMKLYSGIEASKITSDWNKIIVERAPIKAKPTKLKELVSKYPTEQVSIPKTAKQLKAYRAAVEKVISREITKELQQETMGKLIRLKKSFVTTSVDLWSKALGGFGLLPLEKIKYKKMLRERERISIGEKLSQISVPFEKMAFGMLPRIKAREGVLPRIASKQAMNTMQALKQITGLPRPPSIPEAIPRPIRIPFELFRFPKYRPYYYRKRTKKERAELKKAQKAYQASVASVALGIWATPKQIKKLKKK